MRSYYPSETRGSMRKPPRIRAINLSLSLLIFLFFHWTNAVMAGHTTVRCYLELQSCFHKALGVIWRSFLYSLTLREKKVSEARNSNSFSIFLEKPPSGLWSLHFSLYPVTSVVMTVMAPDQLSFGHATLTVPAERQCFRHAKSSRVVHPRSGWNCIWSWKRSWHFIIRFIASNVVKNIVGSSLKSQKS